MGKNIAAVRVFGKPGRPASGKDTDKARIRDDCEEALGLVARSRFCTSCGALTTPWLCYYMVLLRFFGDQGEAHLTRTLMELDEWPRHPTIDTFDQLATASPYWSDGFWFCIGDPEGRCDLITAIRSHPNTNAADGYACPGLPNP